MMISLVHPKYTEPRDVDPITLHELLRYGLFEAEHGARYWHDNGAPEAEAVIRRMIAEGKEIVQWMDEANIPPEYRKAIP